LDILEVNLDRLNSIGWAHLASNPNAISILEHNQDKIDLCYLSSNPNIMQLDYCKMIWIRRTLLDKHELVYLTLKPERVIRHIILHNYNLISSDYEEF